MFFFFKQKTAYEMRISDWSSDVCSSDLIADSQRTVAAMCRTLAACSLALPAACPGSRDLQDCGAVRRAGCFVLRAHPRPSTSPSRDRPPLRAGVPWLPQGVSPWIPKPSAHRCRRSLRSEEHTSELQSLMRISYAVFCLKHK